MLQTCGATRVLLDLAIRDTPSPRSNVSPRVRKVKSLNKPRDKKNMSQNKRPCITSQICSGFPSLLMICEVFLGVKIRGHIAHFALEGL